MKPPSNIHHCMLMCVFKVMIREQVTLWLHGGLTFLGSHIFTSLYCPFDPEIYREHPHLMGRLCMKYHDDRFKGEEIMRHKPFSVITALWPWPLTLKPIGHILNSWGVFVWSFIMIGEKGKQLWNITHFQLSMHCDLDDDRCKKKVVMRRKPFSVIYALWPWPFDLKIYRAHPWLMGSLHVKFHDDRCKGKAVMRRKPFSVIYALWPWPLDLKIYRAHPWLMGSLHHRRPFNAWWWLLEIKCDF